MHSTNDILKGVRILTFTTGYAGPYAGRLLAGYGAEVIKIESRKGDSTLFAIMASTRISTRRLDSSSAIWVSGR